MNILYSVQYRHCPSEWCNLIFCQLVIILSIRFVLLTYIFMCSLNESISALFLTKSSWYSILFCLLISNFQFSFVITPFVSKHLFSINMYFYYKYLRNLPLSRIYKHIAYGNHFKGFYPILKLTGTFQDVFEIQEVLTGKGLAIEEDNTEIVCNAALHLLITFNVSNLFHYLLCHCVSVRLSFSTYTHTRRHTYTHRDIHEFSVVCGKYSGILSISSTGFSTLIWIMNLSAKTWLHLH